MKITGTTCTTTAAWFTLLDCLCFLPAKVNYKNISIRYLGSALWLFSCRRAVMYHLYAWKNCRELGLTNRVCCQFVIRLRATPLTEIFLLFYLVIYCNYPCSIIRCLNSYLRLKLLIFHSICCKMPFLAPSCLADDAQCWAAQLFLCKPGSYLLWGFSVSL